MSSNTTLPQSSSQTDQVYTALYSVLFVVGLMLNSMAAWVFFNLQSRRKTFILYLRHMVAADLLMTLTFLPHILMDAHAGPWWLPAFVCRYSAVLFYVSMYASILFLCLLALDRYLKIVQPFGGSCGACLYSYSFTRLMSVLVWLSMAAMSLPNSILTNQEPRPETARNCTALKSEFGLQWHGVVAYINVGIFLVVLVILPSCYISIYRHIHRSNAQFIISGEGSKRQRHTQNILVVLVVFSVCFVPYHLWRIPFTLSQVEDNFSQWTEDILYHGKTATLFLSSCNVCLDPVIYFLMCASFRRKLVESLGLKNKLCLNRANSIKSTQVLRFREY
ncbi:G-protein coupled receptor 87-like [Chanos chanos]|uniref:G-protein coupled receptor 87-like n=1 Tax=Chanos chanos TaxID=29144 RepID=A0A6J2VRT9_CHACN|nr:G-protein coupled receptor 87-like [Chanos chanos]